MVKPKIKKKKGPKGPKGPKEKISKEKRSNIPVIVIKIKKDVPRANLISQEQKYWLLTNLAPLGYTLVLSMLPSLYEKYGKKYEQKFKQKFEETMKSVDDQYGINKLKTKEEVKAKCNELYKKHHPDKGGDAKEFNKIREICNKKLASFS